VAAPRWRGGCCSLPSRFRHYHPRYSVLHIFLTVLNYHHHYSTSFIIAPYINI